MVLAKMSNDTDLKHLCIDTDGTLWLHGLNGKGNHASLLHEDHNQDEMIH